MELLLVLGLLFLFVSVILKLSFGIVKLALAFVGCLFLIVLLPVGLVLLIPIGLLALVIGFLTLIF